MVKANLAVRSISTASSAIVAWILRCDFRDE